MLRSHGDSMLLTEKQVGVLKGMLLGAISSLCIVGFGSYLNPFGYPESLSSVDKLKDAVVFTLCFCPSIFMLVGIIGNLLWRQLN